MTDQAQQDSIEFRLSKKAKCVCGAAELVEDMPLCGQPYSNGLRNDWCKNIVSGMECGHDRDCHAPSPTQESNNEHA